MSNDIQTRRLIVTLPAHTGEEADIIAASIEDHLLDYRSELAASEVYAVTHALGETLPDGLAIRSHYDDFVLVNVTSANTANVAETRKLSLYEARQLAGALLAIPGVADAAPPRYTQGTADAAARELGIRTLNSQEA